MLSVYGVWQVAISSDLAILACHHSLHLQTQCQNLYEFTSYQNENERIFATVPRKDSTYKLNKNVALDPNSLTFFFDCEL